MSIRPNVQYIMSRALILSWGKDRCATGTDNTKSTISTRKCGLLIPSGRKERMAKYTKCLAYTLLTSTKDNGADYIHGHLHHMNGSA
jgi:hypothetical protein